MLTQLQLWDRRLSAAEVASVARADVNWAFMSTTLRPAGMSALYSRTAEDALVDALDQRPPAELSAGLSWASHVPISGDFIMLVRALSSRRGQGHVCGVPGVGKGTGEARRGACRHMSLLRVSEQDAAATMPCPVMSFGGRPHP